MAGAAAEGADVAFDPLKCRDLVEQPVIARHAVGRFGAQRGMREPAERAEPVVDRHDDDAALGERAAVVRSEEHTSELQSLMRISYAVFCLNNKSNHTNKKTT